MSGTTLRDRFVIERLDTSAHDRRAFTCGVKALDRYLHEQASQDVRSSAAVIYVATPTKEPACIAAFYTLSATSVRVDSFADARKLPRYPNLPGILIGRFAVATAFAGQGLGQYMLMDALGRSHQASESLGSIAIIVDAKDDSAVRFYRRYGFVGFQDDPRRLFLPIQTIAALGLKPPSIPLFVRAMFKAKKAR